MDNETQIEATMSNETTTQDSRDMGLAVSETRAHRGMPLIVEGDRVCGGEPGTEDYDEGRVLAVDGDLVTVGWDNGERTSQSAELLELLS